MAPSEKQHAVTMDRRRRHGINGLYYRGIWLDAKSCQSTFGSVKASDYQSPCPRSSSRSNHAEEASPVLVYDVLVIGAGTVGASVAHELSQYELQVLWVDAGDDVAGNGSGTHATPGWMQAGLVSSNTLAGKLAVQGAKLFAGLDEQLRFGYKQHASLVVATTLAQKQVLSRLQKRAQQAGMPCRMLNASQVLQLQPGVTPTVQAALLLEQSGTVDPVRYTLALAERAVQQGVSLWLRRLVTEMSVEGDTIKVLLQHWEPEQYVRSVARSGKSSLIKLVLTVAAAIIAVHYAVVRTQGLDGRNHLVALGVCWLVSKLNAHYFANHSSSSGSQEAVTAQDSFQPLSPDEIKAATKAAATMSSWNDPDACRVQVKDMAVGGAGSSRVQNGKKVATETVQCRHVVNCAGGSADKVARLLGDASFSLMPVVGDYLVLNGAKQPHLPQHTLWQCPDSLDADDPFFPLQGAVQTSLSGNLVLGPRLRRSPETPKQMQSQLLQSALQCLESISAADTLHSYSGAVAVVKEKGATGANATATSTTTDWLIRPSTQCKRMLHVAGIHGPGLTASPALAQYVVQELKKVGLACTKKATKSPPLAPCMLPKDPKKEMDPTMLVCPGANVTQADIVRTIRQSPLPVDSVEGLRKRTGAGMECVGGTADEACPCTALMQALLARQLQMPASSVGGVPWPATSTLPQQNMTVEQRQALAELAQPELSKEESKDTKKQA